MSSRTLLPARALPVGLLCLGLFGLGGCKGGAAGDRANRGDFKVNLITTGLAQIYPYRIREVDQLGNPTTNIIDIVDEDKLRNNANPNNGVLPVGTFGTSPTLPDGSPGNHFFLFRFSHKLKVESILSNQLANQTNSGLTTAVSLLVYNQSTESTSVIPGRGFVNGHTFYNEGGKLVLRQAVKLDKNGVVQIADARANGFPRGFSGDADLVQPNSFVFVADTDANLTTFETFPSTALLQVSVSSAVRDSEDDPLEQEIATATTVGPDPSPAQVIGYSSNRPLEINPGNNQSDVSPLTTIQVRFNKPVQPLTVGAFFTPTNPIPAVGGMALQVTLAANTFSVIYYGDPVNYGDLMTYRIRPAYSLPGNATVNVTANNTTIAGLDGVKLGTTISTPFNTGAGPGIVNAPVAPDAVYIGIGGSSPGVSVLDLNGFGNGTGDLADTRFPLNPNVGRPGVTPALAPGKSSLDAGSAGALTVVRDSAGNTRLLRDPIVGVVGDIHIGAPLDLVFNNENINLNATRANQVEPVSALRKSGNSITVAPHPNPPRIFFPPPNPARAIFGEEPTVTSSSGPTGTIFTTNPPCSLQPINALVKGNPFANQSTAVGLYGHFMEGVFYGPQPPPASPPPPTPFCPFTARQQVGHFLYVLDRSNRQVLVLNSNRFTILDTIKLTDPFSMAMSPNMRTLAVTNFASSSVSFIDVDPTSPNFHTLVKETRVQPGPTAIAWQPDGEDIAVVSTQANAVTFLGAKDFEARRTVTGFLNKPIDIALTPRYQATGYASGIWFAYILNENGNVAIYESGPDGVNGIGFNDVVGIVPNANFRRPRAIKLDYTNLNSAVFVSHVDENGLGQISRLELTSSPVGPIPISPNSGGFILPPTFRQKEWTITQRFGGSSPTTPGKDLLSGNAPVDFTTDEMLNIGGAVGQTTPFSTSIAPVPWLHSGKEGLKAFGGVPAIPFTPKLFFIALGDTGKLDIFEVDTGKRIRTIDVPGIATVSSYWRQ
jgi:hypothetical protein